MSNGKVVLIGALPESLINFRGSLLKVMSTKYDEVIAMASSATSYEVKKILKYSHSYIDYSVSRNGLNPLYDFMTLMQLIKIFISEKPDLILAYTIKPIIWGGIASRFSKTKRFFALVTGLGFAFQSGGFIKNILVTIVSWLYTIALKDVTGVIFQNQDNMNTFINLGIVDKDRCFIVNGSGVDTNHFNVAPIPKEPNFLLIARLLSDKGIFEYVDAARFIKQNYPNSRFKLVGPLDPSPNSISLTDLKKWHDEGVIDYIGSVNDVRPYIKDCSIYVLPSYHEGMPRSVLEAMSMGRPILTTNVPGCKETVVDGYNGWLVEKCNYKQLADRMAWFINNNDKWEAMGHNSRVLANEKFDVSKVNNDIMKILDL